jgi:hypothetical protein
MIALALLLATVTGNQPPSVYACDGVATVYTIGFPYLATSHVTASVTTSAGVVSTLVPTTDYGIKPALAPTTGSLTLTAASKCPSGATLTITRTVPLTQPQSFRTGAYQGSSHEQALDRLEMQIQQTNRAINPALPFVINAKAFGALGNGVADDTAALQAALNTVTFGGVLYIPSGTYLYTSLVIKNLRTSQIIGDGNRATILRYNGSAGGTAFKMVNCYRNVIRNIRFDRVTNDPAIMIEVQEDKNQSDYDSTAPSQLNRFEEITVKNGGIGVAIGLPAGAVAGDDIMNDTHLFDHNIMDGQTVANVHSPEPTRSASASVSAISPERRLRSLP